MWNQYQIDQQIFHRDSHLVFEKVFATKRFVLDQPCRVMGLGSCSPVLPLRPQMIQRFQLLRLMVSARRFGLQEGLSWHWKFGLALSENNQKQDEQFHCSFFYFATWHGANTMQFVARCFPLDHGFTFHSVLLGNWQFEHSLAIHQPEEGDVAMEASAERNDLRSHQVCCLNMPKLEGEWLEGVELMDISPSPRV